MTPLRSQTERYGERFKRKGEAAVMNIYEFEERHPNVTHKVFDSYDGEWLDYVAACRKDKSYEHYDIIECGIADDQVFDTIDLYFSEVYTREQALAQLQYKKPNHQICITSQTAIDECLHFIKSVSL